MLEEAMGLSPTERAELAAELLDSLPLDELHPDWIVKIERRARAAWQDPLAASRGRPSSSGFDRASSHRVKAGPRHGEAQEELERAIDWYETAACYSMTVVKIPAGMKWIFWDVDFDTIDAHRHADGVIARVLERGCLEDVRWLMDAYGLDRIHAFFRDVGSPEITPRTRSFWRLVFDAKEEPWAEPPAWRRNSSQPWIE